MKNIQIGQKVKLAMMEHLEFEVIKMNPDGSFQIQARLDDNNVLHYSDITAEMLCVIHG